MEIAACTLWGVLPRLPLSALGVYMFLLGKLSAGHGPLAPGPSRPNTHMAQAASEPRSQSEKPLASSKPPRGIFITMGPGNPAAAMPLVETRSAKNSCAGAEAP